MPRADPSRLRPAPHSRALRKGRVSEAGRIYHVRTSTHRRLPLFTDLLAGREVVKAMQYQQACGSVVSLAFVLMPDHLHWLFQLCLGATLEQVMHSMKGHSARRVNDRLGRRGAVWQGGYFDRAVRAEEDVRAVARYILANPLRAGLCHRLADYALWDAVWV